MSNSVSWQCSPRANKYSQNNIFLHTSPGTFVTLCTFALLHSQALMTKSQLGILPFLVLCTVLFVATTLWKHSVWDYVIKNYIWSRTLWKLEKFCLHEWSFIAAKYMYTCRILGTCWWTLVEMGEIYLNNSLVIEPGCYMYYRHGLCVLRDLQGWEAGRWASCCTMFSARFPWRPVMQWGWVQYPDRHKWDYGRRQWSGRLAGYFNTWPVHAAYCSTK